MSNIIKFKRGLEFPPLSALEEYEVGYSTSENNIFIKNNNDQLVMASSYSYNMNITIPTSGTTITIDVSSLPIAITEKTTVFIGANTQDVNLTTSNLKIFRKADMTFKSYIKTNDKVTALVFDIRGSLPSSATTIPIELVVI